MKHLKGINEEADKDIRIFTQQRIAWLRDNHYDQFIYSADIPRYCEWEWLNKLTSRQKNLGQFHVRLGQFNKLYEMWQHMQVYAGEFYYRNHHTLMLEERFYEENHGNSNVNNDKEEKQQEENEQNAVEQPKNCLYNEEPDNHRQEELREEDDDEPISEPVLVFKKDYLPKRANKNGETKAFKCQYCQYLSHTSHRTTKHKKICKQRSSFKKRQLQQKHHSLRIAQMRNQFQQEHQSQPFQPTHSCGWQKQMIQMKKQVQQLKRYVSGIKNTKQLCSNWEKDEHSSEITNYIYNEIAPFIGEILKKRLKEAIHNAVYSGIDVSEIKESIGSRIIDKVNHINFKDIIYTFNEKLEKAHQTIQNISEQHDRSDRTKRDNNRAKIFLENYSELDFFNQERLINDLLKLSSNQRKNVMRYYSLLRRYTMFKQYNQIPKLHATVSWKNVRPHIEIDQVSNWIQQLLSNREVTLACDIWMTVCMGLRSPDLKRVYFFTTNNLPAKSVKIIEKKNKNPALRYIPNSLINLILTTKTPYPITEERLIKARSECLKKYHTFYGFRHLCITSLITALHKSSNYSHFHKNPSTTQQYYLRDDSKQLIDEIFHLDLEKHTQLPQKRNILINLSKTPAIQQVIQKINITINQNQEWLQEFQRDYILSGQVKKEDLSQSEVTPEEKFSILSSSHIFNLHQLELDDQGSCKIEDTLSKLVSNSAQFEQILSVELQKIGKVPSTDSILSVSSTLLNRQIIVYDFEEGAEEPIVQRYLSTDNDMKSEEEQQPIIIAHNSRIFKAAQCIIRPSLDRQSKKKALSQIKNSSNQFVLTNIEPKCSNCKKKPYLETGINQETQKGYLYCKHCKYVAKRSESLQYYLTSVERIKIECIYADKIDYPHTSLGKSKKNNNFRQKIQQRFGQQSYSNIVHATDDVPSSITTAYCSFSAKLTKQIMKNRQYQDYLPLEIKQSIIPNAGEGLFATTDIYSNKIILTYAGVIGTTFSTNMKSDSLFHLGWIISKRQSMQLIISDNKKTNAGRYVNGVSKGYKKNCTAIIGIMNNNQIVVYYYSIKPIIKGEELIIDYGGIYGNLTHSDHDEEQKMRQEVYNSDQ